MEVGLLADVEIVAGVERVVAMEFVERAVDVLAPDLVSTLICPPELRPNSAL